MHQGLVYVDFSSLSTFFSDGGMHIRISVDNFTVKFLLSFLLQNCLDLNSFLVVFLPTLKLQFSSLNYLLLTRDYQGKRVNPQ